MTCPKGFRKKSKTIVAKDIKMSVCWTVYLVVLQMYINHPHWLFTKGNLKMGTPLLCTSENFTKINFRIYFLYISSFKKVCFDISFPSNKITKTYSHLILGKDLT